MELKKRKTGQLYTWGWNSEGQLACGKIGGQSHKPVVATSVKKKIPLVVADYNFAILLTESGGVITWGSGDAGQLGNGEKISNGDPIKLKHLKKGAYLTATGEQHALLVKDKAVYSWGNGADGRLGHGDDTEHLVPMQLGSLSNKKVISVACGSEHSCIIADDTLFTWGKGQYGRLGHGSEKSENTPKIVETLQGKGLKEVVCGSEFTMVLTGAGLFAFGHGANGRLGIGSDSNHPTPVLVDALKDITIKQIACGHHHTMILSDSGHVLSFGYGGNGRLGHGTEADEKKPREIEALKGKGIVFIAAGGYHSAVVNGKGELFSWGWNYYGQLGFEGKDDHFQPTLVAELGNKKVVWVTCGEGNTMAIVA